MYTYYIQATTLFTSAYTSIRSGLDGLVSIKVINLTHVKLLSSLYNIPMVAVYGWIRAIQEIDASTCVQSTTHTSVHTGVHTSGTAHSSGLGASTTTQTGGLGASTASMQYSTATSVDNVMNSSELTLCCQQVITLLESFRS